MLHRVLEAELAGWDEDRGNPELETEAHAAAEDVRVLAITDT